MKTIYLFFTLLLSISFNIACSVSSDVRQIQASEDEIPYKITPRSAVVYIGDVTTLSVGGGAGDYKFKIQSQSGSGASINETTGEFSPGASDTENLVTVLATDRINQQAFATVRVLPSLKLSASAISASGAGIAITQIILGKQVNFLASGGMGPYRFSALSGSMNADTGAFTLNTGVSSVDVTVTDKNNKTKTVTYTVAPALELSLSSSSVVRTGAMTLAGTQNFYASGGIAPYTFSIEQGDGEGSLNSSSSSTIFSPGSTIGFTKITVRDSVGQKATALIEVVDLLRLNVTEVSITKSGTFQFSASGGKGPFTYSVNESNSSFTADQGSISAVGLFTATATFDASARNTRKVTVSDSLGQSAEAIVHVIDQLSLAMTVADLMVGTQAQVVASGGQAPITITAEASCGSMIGSNNDYYKAPDTVPVNPGTCLITATDAVGNVTSKSVKIYPQIQLTLSKQKLATGKTLSMTASGGVINATQLYTFSIVSGGGTIGSGTSYNLADYTAPGSISQIQAMIRVQDTQGNFATSAVDLYSMLTIASPIGNILLNKNVSQNFISAGGFGNIIWSLAPSSVGAVTGTASNTATFQSSQSGSGIVIATDQEGNTAQTNYQVLEGFAALPSHVYIQRSPDSGSGNSVQIDVTGGLQLSQAPYYTFSITSSTLNIANTLQGKFQVNSNIYIAPKSSGTETIRVQDNNSQMINIPVTIYDELSVTPVSTNLMKGQTLDLTVVGGVSPYTWAITSSAGAAGQGAVAEKVSGDSSVYTYDSSSYAGTGVSAIEITITDSKPGTANTIKATINVSSIAKVTAVSANVGSSTQSYFKINDVIPVTVTFDRNIDVTGTPKVQLNAHGSTAYANYVSGSGTITLVFNYEVVSGHSSARLDFQGTTSLQLSGGTIKSSGINADLTLASPNASSSDVNPGATGSLSNSKYLTIDGNAPVTPSSVTLNTPSSSPGTNATPIIDVGTNLENLGTVELHTTSSCNNQVASATINASTKQLTTSTLSEGVYDFYARQKDLAGNYSNCSATPLRYVYDAHQPGANALTIADADSGSTTYTNSTSVTLTISADNAAKMYITNTAGCGSGGTGPDAGWENYSATKTWTLPSTDGSKQVYYKVKNTIGTESACVTSNAITLDTVAATATLSNVPTGTNNTVTLNVGIAGTGVTQYKYKVGESGSTDCTVASGYSADTSQATNITNSISSLADGSIKLCVIGKDSAGNYQSEASATTATWTKLTALPTAVLTGTPTGTNNTTTLNITVGGTNVTSYKYKLGDINLDCSISSGYSGSDIAIATSITNSISGYTDGTVKICLIGKDVAGNSQTEANATTATWTKDTTAPTVTLTGTPTGTNNTTTLNVTVGGTDVVQYKYKVGVSGSTDCTSSTGYLTDVLIATNITNSITGIADGSIKLCVVGSDSTGNYQAYAVATSVTWIKDTAAPGTPSIALHGSNPTPNTQTQPSFTVSSLTVSDTVKIFKNDNTCAAINEVLSASVATTSMTLQPTPVLPEGSYAFYAQAQDAAGNKSACSSGVSYVLDLTAPTIPDGIVLGAVTASVADTPTITIGTLSTDAVGSITYEAQVYDSGNAAVGSPVVFTNTQKATGLSLTNGLSYTLKVRAKDSAGNASSYSTASASWTAQFACPTGYIEVPALAPYTSTNFCVAKYEMKCQGAGCGATTLTQVSPSGTAVAASIQGSSQNYVGPWVTINRDQSITACQNLGAGYDLISNAQWQTIARNIADQAANWGTTENGANATSAYGASSLSHGHADSSPYNALNAAVDTDPCNGTGQTCSQSNWSSQRRTNVLSNGNVIWDLAGNVFEWVKDNNSSAQGADGYASTFNSGDSRQIDYGNDQFCTNAAGGCGFGYGYTNYSGGAVLRGGYWYFGSYSGVFASYLGLGPTYTYSDVGFRCVFQP